MQVYLVIGVVSVIVAAAGLMLRKPLAGRAAIPLWSAIAIGGFALGLGLGCGAMHVLGFRWSPEYPALYVSLTDRIRHPLMPGDRVALLRSGGWLNGPPPDINKGDEGIVVLDIWDDWCPFCRKAAPNLVQVYREFSDRDVEFVSITCSSESTVQQFVDEFGISWPSGFSAKPETLTAYGAVDPQDEVSQTVIPTMYVIRRRDGTVTWSSRSARYQHMSGDDLASQLRSAIEAALEVGHASTKDAESN